CTPAGARDPGVARGARQALPAFLGRARAKARERDGDTHPRLRRLAVRSEERFFDWVTELVHAQRARLSRIVQREGVREHDALDCVQEAFVSFLELPQARLLVGMPQDSAKLLAILARNIARNRRRRHDYAKRHFVEEELELGLVSDAASADELVAVA